MAKYNHKDAVTVASEADKKTVNETTNTVTEFLRAGVMRRTSSGGYVYHGCSEMVGTAPQG